MRTLGGELPPSRRSPASYRYRGQWSLVPSNPPSRRPSPSGRSFQSCPPLLSCSRSALSLHYPNALSMTGPSMTGNYGIAVAEAAVVAAISPRPLRTMPRAKTARTNLFADRIPHLAFPLGGWQRSSRGRSPLWRFPNPPGAWATRPPRWRWRCAYAGGILPP